MASLLTPTFPFPSSSFKGTLTNLTSNPFKFSTLKHKLKLPSPNPTTIKQAIPFSIVSAASTTLVSEPTSSRGAVSGTRLRLDNLGPQPGSRKKAKRKGRGHAAGQGKSCGFGMRGQKSRSGPGVMRGFEGGQMPLYRRLPKLRGIAGGMKAGLTKYVPVNLRDIEVAGFEDGEEVSLESLKDRGIINPSGRERRLPLKILGEGELSAKVHIKARAFSGSAKEKLEAAGCTLTVLPGKKKWVKPSVAKNIARADEYFAKKRAAAAAAASVETDSA